MLINNWTMAEHVLRRLESCTEYVYDAETSGLDWRHNHVVGHVFTFGPSPQDTYYIPVRHARGGNLQADIQIPTRPDEWRGDVHPFEKEWIKRVKGKKMIGHNLSFDGGMLHKLGWTPSAMEDTMVQAYLLDEVRRSLSLSACCKDYKVQEKLGDDLYAYLTNTYGAPAGRDSMSHFWLSDASEPVVWEYASGDGTSTFQLNKVLNEEIDRVYYSNAIMDFSLRRVADMESACTPVIHRMRIHGMRVDEERLQELHQKFTLEIAQAEERLNGINVKSPLAMQKYFTDAGVTDWPLTPTGKPSFPEEWMVKSEEGRAIVAVRKNRTLISSFLDPMTSRFLYKGRIHAEIHQTRDEHFGTKTGRLSVTAPNLSAYPGKRQGELGKIMRSVFVPDDGNEFVEADYKTCEIRVCAHYCKAKVWTEGYRKGIDPHTSVSDSMSIIRRHAKTINLALMTGSGKKAITEKLGLPDAEGSALVDQYFAGLPELKEFQNQAKRNFRSRGFVSTIGGRRLQLTDPNKDYTALNRLTQGGNADLTKTALVMADQVEGAVLNMPVHDSLLFQTRIGDDETRTKVLRAMIDAGHELGFSIPMGVEWGRGMNWGEATFNTEGDIDDAVERA
jgi:DNA polymerase I